MFCPRQVLLQPFPPNIYIVSKSFCNLILPFNPYNVYHLISSSFLSSLPSKLSFYIYSLQALSSHLISNCSSFIVFRISFSSRLDNIEIVTTTTNVTVRRRYELFWTIFNAQNVWLKVLADVWKVQHQCFQLECYCANKEKSGFVQITVQL